MRDREGVGEKQKKRSSRWERQRKRSRDIGRERGREREREREREKRGKITALNVVILSNKFFNSYQI